MSPVPVSVSELIVAEDACGPYSIELRSQFSLATSHFAQRIK